MDDSSAPRLTPELPATTAGEPGHDDLPRPDVFFDGPLSKFVCVVAGIVLPAICLALSAPRGIPRDYSLWQNESWGTYAALMGGFPAVLPFCPLLLYSIVSLVLMTVDRPRYSRLFATRFGLYTGVLLALQFTWMVLLPSANPIAAAIGVLGLALGVAAFSWAVIAGLHAAGPPRSGTIVVAAAAVLMIGSVFLPFTLLLVAALAAPWAFSVYAFASWVAITTRGDRTIRFGLGRMMAAMSWLAAYMAAWRFSYQLMLQEYAKLPVDDPNCFISTAAAQGHARLTGSEPLTNISTSDVRVNDQMRWLKAGELLLQTVWPFGHRLTRRIYDRVGPPAAKAIGTSFRADAAYLMLKPAEWIARGVIRCLGPTPCGLVMQLYRSPGWSPVDPVR